jgi:tetratricopeptide (TPR) repeat protein
LLLALGHQSLATHNYDEAARHYWQASLVAPGSAFVSLCLGSALLGRSFQRTCPNQPAKLVEAMAHFKKCVQLSGGSVRSRFNLARALQVAGMRGEAVRVYREIEEEFAPARYNLSRLLMQR